MTRIKVRDVAKRMTIDLDDMDLANIDDIKETKGFSAMSEAIRHALNITGRICRREAVEHEIELEAYRRVVRRSDG